MVQFTETLEARRVEEWSGNYVAYREIRNLIEKSVERGSGPTTPKTNGTGSGSGSGGETKAGSPKKTSFDGKDKHWKDPHGFASRFIELIEQEMTKVNDFAVAKFGELRGTLSLTLRELSWTNTELKCDWDRMLSRIKAVQASLGHLVHFISLNREGLRKVCKKYDKVVCDGSKMQQWVLARFKTLEIARLDPSTLLVPLSTCFALYRRKQVEREGGETEKTDGVWKPPESFQRKTTKYVLGRRTRTVIGIAHWQSDWAPDQNASAAFML